MQLGAKLLMVTSFHVCVRLSPRRFRQLVERLLQFISTRLFPAEPDDLPPLAKCAWWIPSATKVLGLFSELHTHHIAAGVSKPGVVHEGRSLAGFPPS